MHIGVEEVQGERKGKENPDQEAENKLRNRLTKTKKCSSLY